MTDKISEALSTAPQSRAPDQSERVAELEAEVAEWRQAAGVEAGLRREFLARAEKAEASLAEARKVIEPFAAADRAIGNEPGPFRFETTTGHRLIEREHLAAARDWLARNKEPG